MALDFGNKTANGGTTAQGVLSANEFNQLVAVVNNNTVEVVTITGSTPTQQLAPNTFYKFTGAVTALTLTLGSEVSGIANIYAFSFTAGADNPTISLPVGVEIADEPEIATGDYVEFSIMDNKAIAMVWQTQQ